MSKLKIIILTKVWTPLIRQALVDKGYMTLQEFEKAINEYKKEYSISDQEFEAIQRDDVEK